MTYGGDMQPQLTRDTPEVELGVLERLLAIEHIKKTKAHYCFCIDCKNWDAYETLFTTDAVLEVPPHGPDDEPQRITGRAQIRRFVEAAVSGVATIHHCHMPIIDFCSSMRARVTWAMEDMLRFPSGGPIHTLHGMGHYFEIYRREGDAWLIEHCRIERLRLELQ